jgi:iron complex transport system permease protein
MMSSGRGVDAARMLGVVATSMLLMLVAATVGLGFGSTGWGGLDVLSAVLGGTLDDTQRIILFEARLPRVVFGLLVGAALSVAGAVFQALLRNPLADPYILGVSGGAALGGTIVIAFGLGGLAAGIGVPAAAFAGALGAVALILLVGRWAPGGRAGTYVLLLTGVVFNAFAGSVITFIRTILSPQKAHELLFYLVGTLSVEGTPPSEIAIVAAAVFVSIAGSFWYARDLNVLTLGDDEAKSLGVDVDATRRNVVLAASLGVAVSVAYTGLVGFVGLVVPHGVRLVLGPDHRLLLPVSALTGGAFLVITDVAARAAFGVFSTALPVGVVTAFVGAPIFLFFLRTSLKG